MALRPIRLLGHPDLRTRCDAIEEPLSPGTLLVVDDLRDTLKWAKKEYGLGRAISAPQIGAPVRLVLVEFSKNRWVMINPEITDVGSEDFLVWDDCFSFPDLMVRVQRAYRISLTYVDMRGKQHSIDLDGALAELIQHEVDHVDGILAVDRAVGADPFQLKSEWVKRHKASERYSDPVPRQAVS